MLFTFQAWKDIYEQMRAKVIEMIKEGKIDPKDFPDVDPGLIPLIAVGYMALTAAEIAWFIFWFLLNLVLDIILAVWASMIVWRVGKKQKWHLFYKMLMLFLIWFPIPQFQFIAAMIILMSVMGAL